MNLRFKIESHKQYLLQQQPIYHSHMLRKVRQLNYTLYHCLELANYFLRQLSIPSQSHIRLLPIYRLHKPMNLYLLGLFL